MCGTRLLASLHRILHPTGPQIPSAAVRCCAISLINVAGRYSGVAGEEIDGCEGVCKVGGVEGVERVGLAEGGGERGRRRRKVVGFIAVVVLSRVQVYGCLGQHRRL